MLVKNIITIGGFFCIITLGSCRSEKTNSHTQVVEVTKKENTFQWPLPDTPIHGCDNMINQTFMENHIEWLSGPPTNQTPLKVFLLIKSINLFISGLIAIVNQQKVLI